MSMKKVETQVRECTRRGRGKERNFGGGRGTVWDKKDYRRNEKEGK